VSDNIKEFPTAPLAVRSATALADYLQNIADHIRAGDVETDPHAILLVLTGMDRHEVLKIGYQTDRDGLGGAVRAVEAVCLTPYKTQGDNMRTRSHPLYGRTIRPEPPKPADGTKPGFKLSVVK
jgi:hypothetical protein